MTHVTFPMLGNTKKGNLAKKREGGEIFPEYTNDPLGIFLASLSGSKLISREEEQRLTRRVLDGEAAKKMQKELGAADPTLASRVVAANLARDALVQCNLRFIYKVCREFRNYGLDPMDLVQEGSVGFLKAIEKFEPDRGLRLISYGVWWIRAKIQNFILANWSLVRLGTTQGQRKLFFSLNRTKAKLMKLGLWEDDDHDKMVALLAKHTNTTPREVVNVWSRTDSRDYSLDVSVEGSEGGGPVTHLDLLEDHHAPHDEVYKDLELRKAQKEDVANALRRLDVRERHIIQQRYMTDDPMTLSELGDHYGFSRERARQLEARAVAKLKILLYAWSDE